MNCSSSATSSAVTVVAEEGREALEQHFGGRDPVRAVHEEKAQAESDPRGQRHAALRRDVDGLRCDEFCSSPDELSEACLRLYG